MDEKITINGKPAIRINASIRPLPPPKSCYVVWHGEGIWTPNSLMRINSDGTIDIVKWFYDKEFKKFEL